MCINENKLIFLKNKCENERDKFVMIITEDSTVHKVNFYVTSLFTLSNFKCN